MLSTGSVIWPRNKLMTRRANWSEFFPKLFLASFTNGLMISSMSFKLSCVLLKYFREIYFWQTLLSFSTIDELDWEELVIKTDSKCSC